MTGLKDRVIIIAGGARGIGAATAHRIAEGGAKVVIADINVTVATETVACIEGAGGTAAFFGFDISDPKSVKDLFKFVLDKHGRVDGLFNNAADLRLNERDPNILDVDIDTWNQMLKVDLTGYFLTMREAIPLMIEQGGGSIINTSSAAVFWPLAHPSYAAAKAGVITLTRHVALTYGRQGVRCNSIAPGSVATEGRDAIIAATGAQELFETVRASLEHSHREGQPRDIAAMAALLLSDDGSWINGQCISVDGGWTMR